MTAKRELPDDICRPVRIGSSFTDWKCPLCPFKLDHDQVNPAYARRCHLHGHGARGRKVLKNERVAERKQLGARLKQLAASRANYREFYMEWHNSNVPLHAPSWSCVPVLSYLPKPNVGARSTRNRTQFSQLHDRHWQCSRCE